MKEGKTASDVRVDTRMQVVKEKSAQWLIGFSDYLKSNPDIMVNGFKAAGIIDSIENECDAENSKDSLDTDSNKDPFDYDTS